MHLRSVYLEKRSNETAMTAMPKMTDHVTTELLGSYRCAEGSSSSMASSVMMPEVILKRTPYALPEKDAPKTKYPISAPSGSDKPERIPHQKA